MTSLVRQSGAYSPFCSCGSFFVKLSGNDDSLHTLNAKFRQPENSVGQIFILWNYTEAFFQEAVDSDGRWRVGKHIRRAQFVGTDDLDLFVLIEGAFSDREIGR